MWVLLFCIVEMFKMMKEDEMEENKIKENIIKENIIIEGETEGRLNKADSEFVQKYKERAVENFYKGYNCTQSVMLAFSDLHHMDEKTSLLISSSFGGGMGRLREVCGAVSGMFMVAGLLYGYDGPKQYEEKKEHYERIQYLAQQYQKENGSIVCRELLGLGNGKDAPAPSKRTKEYYKKRPCPQLIGMAAYIMARYVEEHGLTGKVL